MVICIHLSSCFEFQYNNWKNKARIVECRRINLGVIVRGGLCPGVFVLEPQMEQVEQREFIFEDMKFTANSCNT